MADNTDIYAYNGSDSEIDENALILKVIDPTDTIKTMMEKCNYNFTQLVMHGGGPRGVQGEPGIDGATGKRGNGIFIVTLDGSESDIDSIDLSLYMPGDIILCDGKLYQIAESEGGETILNEEGSIVGPKGDQGPVGEVKDILEFLAKKADTGDVYLTNDTGCFYLYSDADIDISLPETTSYTLNFVRKNDGIGFFNRDGIKTGCIINSDDDECLRIAAEGDTSLSLYSEGVLDIKGSKITIGNTKDKGIEIINDLICIKTRIGGTTSFDNIACEDGLITVAKIECGDIEQFGGTATFGGSSIFNGYTEFTKNVLFREGLSLPSICVDNIAPQMTDSTLFVEGKKIELGGCVNTTLSEKTSEIKIYAKDKINLSTEKEGHTQTELKLWSYETTIGGNTIHIGESFAGENELDKTYRIDIVASEGISINTKILSDIQVQNGNGYSVYAGNPLGQICMIPEFAPTPAHWFTCPVPTEDRDNTSFKSKYSIGDCVSIGVNTYNTEVKNGNICFKIKIRSDISTTSTLNKVTRIDTSNTITNGTIDTTLNNNVISGNSTITTNSLAFKYYKFTPKTGLEDLARALLSGAEFDLTSTDSDCENMLYCKRNTSNPLLISSVTFVNLPMIERPAGMKYIIRYS